MFAAVLAGLTGAGDAALGVGMGAGVCDSESPESLFAGAGVSDSVSADFFFEGFSLSSSSPSASAFSDPPDCSCPEL